VREGGDDPLEGLEEAKTPKTLHAAVKNKFTFIYEFIKSLSKKLEVCFLPLSSQTTNNIKHQLSIKGKI